MRCHKVHDQLSAFLDDELPTAAAKRIQAHLDSCPNCRAELDLLRKTIRSVKDLPAVPAPADLRDNILPKLHAPEVEQPPLRRHSYGASATQPRPSTWRVLWPAAAAVILAAVIALLTRQHRARPGTRDTALRSLTSSELARVDKDEETPDAFRAAAKKAAPPVLKSRVRPGYEVAAERSRPEPALARRGKAAAPPAEHARRLKIGKAGPLAESTVQIAADQIQTWTGALAQEDIFVLAKDLRSAFRTTVNFANTNGWITTEELRRAIAADAESEKPVTQVIFFLTRPEIRQLKEALTRAGLQQLPRRPQQQIIAKAGERRAYKIEKEAVTFHKRIKGAPPPPANRVLIPHNQSIAQQNAILEDIRNADLALNQITLNFDPAEVPPAASGPVETDAEQQQTDQE